MEIINALTNDGIPNHIIGFVYLVLFIEEIRKNPLSTTKTYDIYKKIAQENNVTVQSVQRALRRGLIQYSKKVKNDKKYSNVKEYAYSIIRELK
jgi:Zn-dependent peptidase ImmA (M78 family)